MSASGGPPPFEGENPPSSYPFFDPFSDTPTVPAGSGGLPLYPTLKPICFTPHTTSQSILPMTSYSIKFEYMSTVAIFAVLRLYPEKSLIGMDEDGNFSIYKQDWIGTRLYASFCRFFMTGENGDQLIHLAGRIQQACSIYDSANKSLGIIFLLAYQGAKRLKNEYEEKKRPTVVSTLSIISNLFLQKVRSCHSVCPLPETLYDEGSFTPKVTSGTVMAPPPATPIDSSPSSTSSEKPFWSPEKLEHFSKNLIDGLCHSPTAAIKNMKIEALLKIITDTNSAYRSYTSTGLIDHDSHMDVAL